MRMFSVNWLKTVYVNFYYFNIGKALKLPILMGYGVRIGSLGNRKAVQIPSQFGVLCFALKGGPYGLINNASYWYIGKSGVVKIKGTCRMSKGINMKVFDGAILSIGGGFTSNTNLIISCANSIEIGEDNLLGWNITIMDNDGGHTLCCEGKVVNEAKPIIFGNHVWVSAESSILKGSIIADGSVIGFKSNVCGFTSEFHNSLIVGNPAREKKIGCTWIH